MGCLTSHINVSELSAAWVRRTFVSYVSKNLFTKIPKTNKQLRNN